MNGIGEDSVENSHEFYDETTRHFVFVEDDGSVAYAYLLDSDQNIVGDVWLYNVGPAPVEPPWSLAESEPPFKNPMRYIRSGGDILPIIEPSEIAVSWVSKDGALIQAQVSIRGEKVAVLAPGKSPGWSSLVSEDGPLALCAE